MNTEKIWYSFSSADQLVAARLADLWNGIDDDYVRMQHEHDQRISPERIYGHKPEQECDWIVAFRFASLGGQEAAIRFAEELGARQQSPCAVAQAGSGQLIFEGRYAECVGYVGGRHDLVVIARDGFVLGHCRGSVEIAVAQMRAEEADAHAARLFSRFRPSRQIDGLNPAERS